MGIGNFCKKNLKSKAEVIKAVFTNENLGKIGEGVKAEVGAKVGHETKGKVQVFLTKPKKKKVESK